MEAQALGPDAKGCFSSVAKLVICTIMKKLCLNTKRGKELRNANHGGKWI